MHVTAMPGSCSDQGGISPAASFASAKNPGRPNVTAAIPAKTRPTSTPRPTSAVPSVPAASSTSLSRFPVTYSRTMAGRAEPPAAAAPPAATAPAAEAGRTSSTSGTGTHAPAAAMTAASMAGSVPPSRTTAGPVIMFFT